MSNNENSARFSAQVFKAGWLGQQNAGFRDAMLQAGRLKRFADRDPIYGFDDKKDGLFGIVSGAVRLFVQRNDSLRLGHVGGPGYWFGEVEFITNQPTIMSVEAAGDTELLVISEAAFDRVANTRYDAWRSVAQLCAYNVDLAAGAGDDLMLRDPTSRLVALLLRLSSNRHAYQGVAPLEVIPATQEEVSAAANMSRSTGTAVLADLSRRGWLETGYRGIRIIDADAINAYLVSRNSR